VQVEEEKKKEHETINCAHGSTNNEATSDEYSYKEEQKYVNSLFVYYRFVELKVINKCLRLGLAFLNCN
jgi:hypothetical protein